ncbi:hypothetical protein CRE_14628 [Caenorhabditis remanei]|uniref:SCP domain-containing protein n=1 Tax=Caenorhabditis remanei TaxID=31234 RepID=E3M961_CAERE|nr:hypothetical protein CRE_14628 [Caenorhabditis remanei]
MMIKTLLLALLLLGTSSKILENAGKAIIGAVGDVQEESIPLPFGTPEEFLVEVNQARRDYARKHNIPNMRQLVWSEDLVKIAEKLDMEVNWPEARVSWRYCNLDRYYGIAVTIRNRMAFHKMMPKEETLKFATTFTLDTQELLVPMQAKIGCVKKGERVLCLLGPTGSYWYPEGSVRSEGAPGSDCGEGYTNNGGLCALSGIKSDEENGKGEISESAAPDLLYVVVLLMAYFL